MGVYRRTDSPMWWMSMQVDGTRVRLNTRVTDRRMAEQIFAAWQVEHARARWLGTPPAQHHTIQELLVEYQATVTPRKSAASQDRDRRVCARLDQRWGTLSLGEVTAKMLEDELARRLQDVSFATVSKELGILKAAYRCARRWGWTTATPFADLPLNQEGTERLRWLTEAEETALLAACPPWLQDLVVVGLDTGLRRSNLLGLQWPWLSSDGQALTVPRAQVKAKKRAITVPLTARAAAVIHRQPRRPTCAWVFAHEEGTPYRGAHVSMALLRAARRAKVEGVSFYTLRHTFVSRLVQEGRPLPEVAALAGHQDIRMTMRYAHVAPEHLRASIRALDARRARLAPRPDAAAASKSVTLASRSTPRVA